MRKPKYSLDERRELKSRLKGVMMNHVGPTRKIGMGELYEQVFGEGYGHRINDTKMVRVFIDELQNEGIRICSSRSNVNGGYWLAATTTEITGYTNVLKKEIMHKAKKIAALHRVAVPELLGQMALNLQHGAESTEHGE